MESLLGWSESLGKRYSFRNKVDQDESVAESYYILCEYWAGPLFKVKGVDKGVMGRVIVRGLITYFRGVSKFRRNQIRFTLEDQSFEDDIIDFLSEHVDDPFTFACYLKQGLSIQEISFLSDDLKSTCITVSKLLSSRLRKVARDASLPAIPGLQVIIDGSGYGEIGEAAC